MQNRCWKVGLGTFLEGTIMPWDMNALEGAVDEKREAKDFGGAREIYLVMGDGDPSLDAGGLAHQIAQTYEAEGRLMEAKYWYNRALEENPEIPAYQDAAARFRGYFPESVRQVLGDSLTD
jgi:hypothetical protein